MERGDQKGVDRDPAPGARAPLVPPDALLQTQVSSAPLCCVAGEVVRPAGRG